MCTVGARVKTHTTPGEVCANDPILSTHGHPRPFDEVLRGYLLKPDDIHCCKYCNDGQRRRSNSSSTPSTPNEIFPSRPYCFIRINNYRTRMPYLRHLQVLSHYNADHISPVNLFLKFEFRRLWHGMLSIILIASLLFLPFVIIFKPGARAVKHFIVVTFDTWQPEWKNHAF